MLTRPFRYCQHCGVLTPVCCYACNEAYCFDHLQKTALDPQTIVGYCAACLEQPTAPTQPAQPHQTWHPDEVHWWKQAMMDDAS
jgi:hypothetical protein